jgi:hypothetical protein
MTDFDIVWQQYPRKTAKAVALKAWNKIAPDTATVQLMIDALTWQTQTDQWQRGIVPHFSTWLNQARWEDEGPSSVQRPPVPLEQLAHALKIRERQAQEKAEDAQAVADAYYRAQQPAEPTVWTMSEDKHAELMRQMRATKEKLFAKAMNGKS